MDEQKKPWWQSTGVWGSLVAIVASGAGMLGYSVGPADQAAIVSGVEQAVHLVTDAVALVGAGVALWGRIRATKAIA